MLTNYTKVVLCTYKPWQLLFTDKRHVNCTTTWCIELVKN